MSDGAIRELCFRPSGVGRFFVAAFLLVWLCGWAVGEAFGLYMLVAGLVALLTGQPLPGKNEPSDIGAASAIGGFLLVIAAITGLVWSVLFLLIRGSLREPKLWVLTVMVGALALWLIRQSLWLYRDRTEWRIERGRLVHQRRHGGEVTELAEARALELTGSADDDGDRWYTLAAIVTDRPNQKPGQRVTIHKTIHDPSEPRRLGLWLARRAAIPLRDLVPDEAARQAELTRLTEALAGCGKWGQWLSKKISSQVTRRR